MANNFSQNQDEGNGPPSDRTQESRMQNNQEEGSGPPPDRTRESWTQHNQEEGNGPPSDRTQESGVQNTRYVMLASDGIENAALQQAEDMTISNSMPSGESSGPSSRPELQVQTLASFRTGIFLTLLCW
jgi:hypothetical protein